MTRRRVAVSAVGAYTGFGPGVAALWKGCLSGGSCITAGDNDATLTSPAGDRVFELAFQAAGEALASFGISPEATDLSLVLGTNVGRVSRLGRHGAGDPAASLAAEAIDQWADHHVLALDLATRLGCSGQAVALTGACASGALALGHGMDLIAGGECKAVLAGGADELTEFKTSGHRQLRTASPSGKVRPFDADRDGTQFCEGAGFMLLESLGHCIERGRRPLAILAGWGVGSDTLSLTAPDPEGTGAALAMRAALSDARMTPGQIDHVQAHGTGTRLNDPIEARAIGEVLGPDLARVSVSADKGAIGHTFGASGVLGAILVILMMRHGLVLPVTGLDAIAGDCPLPLVTGRAIRRPISAALCNSFGFGGGNASVVLKRHEPRGRRP